MSAEVPDQAGSPALLAINDLRIDFTTPAGTIHAVQGLSLVLSPGEVLAVVGESGAGKSATAWALMGLLPRTASVTGSIRFLGQEIIGLGERDYDALRGARLAIVPQDSLGTLTPAHTLLRQVADAVRAHQRSLSRRQCRERAAELLRLVGIAEGGQRHQSYPHQVSGGMRQRTVIAMALAHDPEVIIADEPTSALDVTVQAQILETLQMARARTGAALLLITHDFGVVAGHADQVLVMHDGAVVEAGTVDDVLLHPQTPYARLLLESSSPPAARPEHPPTSPAVTSGGSDQAGDNAPVLSVQALVVHFNRRRVLRGPPPLVHAVCGVSFDLYPGRTLSLVGETGCGKSTLGRALLGLVTPTSGSIRLVGREVGDVDLRARAPEIQIVFQDSRASLDPRMPVGAAVAEPLRIHGRFGPTGHAQVAELLRSVGLPADIGARFPHQLSGGQRQRVSIARALALEPRVIVLDEPVTALDPTSQADILDLLSDLQDHRGLALVFIAHDLAVVRRLAHEVAVMYLGALVETGPADAILERPSHPYTQALLSAAPSPDPRRERARQRLVLTGEVPDPTAPPSGCRFRTRCPKAQDICAEEEPALLERGQGHPVACHFAAPLDLIEPPRP